MNYGNTWKELELKRRKIVSVMMSIEELAASEGKVDTIQREREALNPGIVKKLIEVPPAVTAKTPVQAVTGKVYRSGYTGKRKARTPVITGGLYARTRDVVKEMISTNGLLPQQFGSVDIKNTNPTLDAKYLSVVLCELFKKKLLTRVSSGQYTRAA